jgi:predicted RNA-binding protein with PUA-like domain
MPNYFLAKTEPSEFSFDDLARKGTSRWDGVTNAQAINTLRTMKPGDQVFIYHTANEKSIVGIATVMSAPYEDPNNTGTTADGRIKHVVIDLQAGPKAKAPLSLESIKADPSFKSLPLLTHSRLSVMPIDAASAKRLQKLTGLI